MFEETTMTDQTVNPNPQSRISMWGEGDYSLYTKGAQDVIENAMPLGVEAIGAMAVEDGHAPFQIVDYAAADGGTSVNLHRALVGAVRQQAPARPVCITYTDLPSNDFSALFRIVQGNNPNYETYLNQFADVYTFASATSFFEAIFPPNSVDFGFSATAMHWLSAMPCEISNHIHAVGARAGELDQLRARAAADWETILLRRARELKPGGRLLMANLAIDDQGRHMGNTGGVHMFDTINALWRELVADRTISEKEYRRLAVPQFYRTLDEFRAPLTDPQSAVYEAGLRLESAVTEYVACPYAAQFERDGDATAFARAFVPTTRTWSETAFLNCLDDNRGNGEKRAITNRLFDNYVELVERAPEGHGMAYIHAYLLIRKE